MTTTDTNEDPAKVIRRLRREKADAEQRASVYGRNLSAERQESERRRVRAESAEARVRELEGHVATAERERDELHAKLEEAEGCVPDPDGLDDPTEVQLGQYEWELRDAARAIGRDYHELGLHLGHYIRSRLEAWHQSARLWRAAVMDAEARAGECLLWLEDERERAEAAERERDEALGRLSVIDAPLPEVHLDIAGDTFHAGGKTKDKIGWRVYCEAEEEDEARCRVTVAGEVVADITVHAHPVKLPGEAQEVCAALVWSAIRCVRMGCAALATTPAREEGAEDLDLDLLRKLASGEGGRRTGALARAGLLEWRVTEEGRRALGSLPAHRGEGEGGHKTNPATSRGDGEG